jgi:hypothetical protein
MDKPQNLKLEDFLPAEVKDSPTHDAQFIDRSMVLDSDQERRMIE